MSTFLIRVATSIGEIVNSLRERAMRAQSGQALVEYVVILALLVLLVVLAMKSLQPAISHTLNQTACTLNSAGTTTPAADAACPAPHKHPHPQSCPCRTAEQPDSARHRPHCCGGETGCRPFASVTGRQPHPTAPCQRRPRRGHRS